MDPKGIVLLKKKLVTELVTQIIGSLGILGRKKVFLMSVTGGTGVTGKIGQILTFFYFL